MRRKSILLGKGLLLLAVVAAAPLWLLLKAQPAFYERWLIPDGEARAARSADFAGRYAHLLEGGEKQPGRWQEVFTTEQINSFLQHDYLSDSRGYKKLPSGFRDLRVEVERGMLRIGCRYGALIGGTILTIEARMWLVEGQVNVIGVELGNFRAGALPVPRDVIFDCITEACARSKIAVSWQYLDDNPVAYLRLQADREQPTIVVERLELRPGRIIIAGRTTEHPNAKNP